MTCTMSPAMIADCGVALQHCWNAAGFRRAGWWVTLPLMQQPLQLGAILSKGLAGAYQHRLAHAGTVGLWEAGSGRRRHMLEGPDAAIEWLDWHPRGDLILAGSEDFTTWLWNAQTGACMAVRHPVACACRKQSHYCCLPPGSSVMQSVCRLSSCPHVQLPLSVLRFGVSCARKDIDQGCARSTAGAYRACRASEVWPLHSRRESHGDWRWRERRHPASLGPQEWEVLVDDQRSALSHSRCVHTVTERPPHTGSGHYHAGGLRS